MKQDIKLSTNHREEEREEEGGRGSFMVDRIPLCNLNKKLKFN